MRGVRQHRFDIPTPRFEAPEPAQVVVGLLVEILPHFNAYNSPERHFRCKQEHSPLA